MVSEVGQHIIAVDRKCELTASVDPAPMVMINSHISVWRLRYRRVNRPPCRFLESASLGRVDGPMTGKRRVYAVGGQILAWLKIESYRIQEDRPEGARGVIEAFRYRRVQSRNDDGGELLELWPE
jgi:hypothetical protein